MMIQSKSSLGPGGGKCGGEAPNKNRGRFRGLSPLEIKEFLNALRRSVTKVTETQKPEISQNKTPDLENPFQNLAHLLG